MYFLELIKNYSKNESVELLIDMDGVIASYDFGKPLNFKTKRPLKSNITTLEKISKLKNVECTILSICHKDKEIEDKNEWLDRYAPFFPKNKRFILSKETIKEKSSAQMKLDFIKNYQSNKKIIIVDDDNYILKELSKNAYEYFSQTQRLTLLGYIIKFIQTNKCSENHYRINIKMGNLLFQKPKLYIHG